MILSILVSLPVLGIFVIVCKPFFSNLHLLERKDRLIKELNVLESIDNNKNTPVIVRLKDINTSLHENKVIALFICTLNFLISLLLLFLFNSSKNHFQFVVESINIYEYNFYLGVDGISLFFVLLTTIIMPIAILSN